MMKFVLYYYFNTVTQSYTDYLGSDKYLPVDGRLSEFNIVRYVNSHPHTEFMVKNKKCIGYTICFGTLSRYREGDLIKFDSNYITSIKQ